MPLFTCRRLYPLLLSLCLAGCITQPSYEDAAQDRFIATNHAAADHLLTQGPHLLAKTRPLLTATLADIDALEHSSTLGRMISEQISARASALGYTAVEIKLRGFPKRTPAGEFLLSRELQDLGQTHNASAAIVGSYALGEELIYVNLKLIDLRNGTILNGYNYSLPRNRNLNMLTDKQDKKQHLFQDSFYAL